MSAGPALPVRRALVLGAGLAAARVLAEHVDEVCIVECDRLPDAPQPRAETPQSRHIHNLLLRGLYELESLFPGFDIELGARGGVRVDLTRDMHFHSIWDWFPRYDSDLRACLRACHQRSVASQLGAFNRRDQREAKVARYHTTHFSR